jgi:hypothetical protein
MVWPAKPLSTNMGSERDPLSPLHFFLSINPVTQILDLTTSHGILHKICDRGNILRTWLYGGAAALFVAPFKEDIQNIPSILHYFREVTDLCTSFQKTFHRPGPFLDIDLGAILEGLSVEWASFPNKYLELLLLVWQLTRFDFQPLEDKMGMQVTT